MSVADAEQLDLEPEPKILAPQDMEIQDAELGRGKCCQMVNKLYTSSAFWRHHDGDDWVADKKWVT